MTTELVVKFEGGVVESNLEEYEKVVKSWIKNINTKLDTEEDFSQAQKDIEKAQDIENKLHNVKQDALSQLGDAFKIMTRIDQWAEEIRQTVRLNLNSQIKTEKARKRTEAIDNGLKVAKEILSGSPVEHLISFDKANIEKCLKNKRDINKAVGECIEALKDEVAALTETYVANTVLIEDAEDYVPGLFPDKKTLAGKDKSTVEAEIEARIAKHKLAVAEREAKAKAENEAAAKDDAKSKTEATVSEGVFERDFPQDNAATNTIPNNAENSTTVEENQREVVDHTEVYYITIVLNCTKDRAISFAEGLDANLGYNDIVKKIGLSK